MENIQLYIVGVNEGKLRPLWQTIFEDLRKHLWFKGNGYRYHNSTWTSIKFCVHLLFLFNKIYCYFALTQCLQEKESTNIIVGQLILKLTQFIPPFLSFNMDCSIIFMGGNFTPLSRRNEIYNFQTRGLKYLIVLREFRHLASFFLIFFKQKSAY